MDSRDILMLANGSAITCMLIYCIYLYNEGNSRMQKLLSLAFLIWSLVYIKDLVLKFYGIYEDSGSEYYIITDIIVFPSAFFIMIELVYPRYVTTKFCILQMLPFILIIASYFIFAQKVMHYVALSYCVVYVIYVIIFLSVYLPKRIKKIQPINSYDRHSRKILIQTFSAFFTFYIIWMFVRLWGSDTHRSVYYICSILLWSTILWLIYKHKVNSVIAKNDIDESNQIEKDSFKVAGLMNNSSKEEISTKYIFEDDLIDLFENKQIFLNPKLTINDVANELRTNRTYLSEYLNSVVGANFYDYVNEYRLYYASKLLIENQMWTLEYVAEQSGFNSISTFRRSFKKQFKCTPNEYRKFKLIDTKGG